MSEPTAWTARTLAPLLVLVLLLARALAALEAPADPPPGTEDLRYRAESLYLDGEVEAAAALYVAAAERATDPVESARSLVAAAWLELVDRSPADARSHLSDALALDPDLDFDPRLYSPDFERLYRELRAAPAPEGKHRAPLRAAPVPGPPDPAALYRRALRDLERGSDDTALERLERVASQTFGGDRAARELRGKALAAIGWIFFDRGQWTDAATAFEAAIDLDRRDVDRWRDLGLARLREDDTAGASAAFREAYALRPDDPGIARLLARALVDAELWDEAVSWIADATRHHAEDAELHLQLGLAATGRGSHRQAAAAFDSAMRLDRTVDWEIGRRAAVHLALAHYEAGRAEEGAAVARRALERRTGDAELWNLLGLNAQAAGDAVAARDAFLAACEHDGSRADYANNLGRAHVAAGELAAAESAFVRALTLDPDDPIARANLLRVREMRAIARSAGRQPALLGPPLPRRR